MQIGQDRGGMYSYDWLENLIGLEIHSSNQLHDEWQHPEVGDRVVLVPAGFLGMKDGYSLPIERIDQPHTLVLRQAPPEHPWDAVWSFHIRPRPGGGSRLISRSRSHRHRGVRGAVDLTLDIIMDPVTWFMTRKMLLGIRDRAEGDRAPGRRAALHIPDASVQAGRLMGWDRRGQFRMRPDQAWMSFHSWQFNMSDPITRLIRMRIDVAGIIPMFGTDTYLRQAGRMQGKVLGLVTVADGEGREFDLGELVTYVDEATMLAPSMLLTPACVWLPVDNGSFDVVFTDGPNTVRARLFVDDHGRLVTFRTEDRWYAGTHPPTRTTWTTPVDGWTTRADGRPIPAWGSAVWHLSNGDFTYVRGRFDPTNLRDVSSVERMLTPASA